MNRLFCRFLVSVTGLLLCATAVVAATPVTKAPAKGKTAEHFERTMERIDALLKNRLNPTPLPATLPNPFDLPGGAQVTTPANDNDDPTPATSKPVAPTFPTGSDSEILAFLAARLKISGTAQFNGQIHLIINRVPYKEGDLIPVTIPTGFARLRLTGVSLTELTLGLNEATQTLKLKL